MRETKTVNPIDDDTRVRIAQVFTAQRGNRLALKRASAGERIDRLTRLRAMIVERAEAIDAALNADLGKPRQGDKNGEVMGVLGDIDLAVAELDAWMQVENVEPSAHFAGNQTYVMYEPRGVVLLFGAWNFPFSLVLGPLVPIIAAGNSAIVKPNELQPETSRLVAKLLRDTFPEEEVAVFEGGVDLAEVLLELPVDHIFFTGSPAVGRRIMAAAARHLASVTLELGGKCPAILDAECDLDQVAEKIVTARFINAGQICLAVDHVWLPRNRVEALVAALDRAIEARFFVDATFRSERMSRLVDSRNLARVASYIEDAVRLGARLIRGGEVDEASLSIAPAVLVDVPLESKMMQHEIFGPVLPVLAYDDMSDVSNALDDMGKPLALYIFGNDPAFIEDVLERTSSGGVTVNDVFLHQAERRLPFGGVNASGIGRYKGVHGFRELSNARSIFVKAG